MKVTSRNIKTYGTRGKRGPRLAIVIRISALPSKFVGFLEGVKFCAFIVCNIKECKRTEVNNPCQQRLWSNPWLTSVRTPSEFKIFDEQDFIAMPPSPSEVIDLTRSSPDIIKGNGGRVQDARVSQSPRPNDGAAGQALTLGKKRKREQESNKGERNGETPGRKSKQRGGDGAGTRADDYGGSGEAKPLAGKGRSDSYSPERERVSSPLPSDIFCIDTKPAIVSSDALHKHLPNGEVREAPVLLLPSHVSVFGEVPFEILAPSTSETDNEDYIEYLDYDDRKVCASRISRFSHMYAAFRIWFGTSRSQSTCLQNQPGLFVRIVGRKENTRRLHVQFLSFVLVHVHHFQLLTIFSALRVVRVMNTSLGPARSAKHATLVE